jgi:ERCC4-related helicase
LIYKNRELVIIGGVSIGEQTRVLREGVDIIVATPGRLEELISGGEIDLTHMRFFILDEAVNQEIYLFLNNFFLRMVYYLKDIKI